MSKEEPQKNYHIHLKLMSPFLDLELGPVWWDRQGILEAIRQAKAALEAYEAAVKWVRDC